MENNNQYVRESQALHEGAASLVERCVEMATLLIQGTLAPRPPVRGGRKAHELDTRAQLPVLGPRGQA